MEEPKSSIHFEHNKEVKIGYFYHNSREKQTANSIFSTKDNYCNISGKEATKLFLDELNKRIEAYVKNKKRKLHKNTIKHISAVVNIKSNTTKEDLEKLIKFLEEELGTKVIQWSIHKDEGHIDPITKEKKINYHAHLELIGLDENGNSVRRKLDKKKLIYIQDKVAEILQMERGINYTKERKKRPRRLDTYQYKKVMQEFNKQARELEKQVKSVINKQQKKLLEKYAEEKGILSKEEYVKKDIALAIINKTTKDNKLSIIDTIIQNKQLKQEKKLLAREKEEKIKQLRTEKEELEKENILLKRENAKLKQENKQLEQENNKLKDIVNRLIEELANTKARISQNFDKAKRIIREKIRENLGINF